MLENFIFENHLGQRFIGSENGVYLNYNDLRDYEWKYDTINGKISRFYQDISEKSLPLVVINKSKDASVKAKNLLLELSEVDVEAMLPGKIYIGEYYINGYVTASKKSNYLINSRYCSVGLTFTCNNPTWYKEQTQVFIPESEDTSGSGYGFEYPYDYKYDYPSPNKGKTIFCDSIRSNSFRMRIFGEITNPTVIINGHRYTVNCKVGKNENIVIDSRNSLAFHLGAGIAVPYGNASVVPFEKRYFSGGANSVRGWSVRDLGPGSFPGDNNFLNQSGDIKLDASIEYRTRLFWKFRGAAFIDAGNIWTLRDYEEQPGGAFRFNSFYKEIAVAYGLGLRFDFDYFILRFDGGMKAINPAYESGKDRYPLIRPDFGRDFAFHFAVGYPF